MNRTMFVAMMAAFVVVPMAQPAGAATRGECITAVVDSPFRLPDGLLYPAGSLTLCDYGLLSPVETLHRVFVGGSSVGMFRSRRRSAEAASIASPELHFSRNTDGNLELIGYAMPTSGHVVAYRMTPPVEPLQARTRATTGGGSPPPVAAIVATARGR
jgi:hypothetical protein